MARKFGTRKLYRGYQPPKPKPEPTKPTPRKTYRGWTTPGVEESRYTATRRAEGKAPVYNEEERYVRQYAQPEPAYSYKYRGAGSKQAGKVETPVMNQQSEYRRYMLMNPWQKIQAGLPLDEARYIAQFGSPAGDERQEQIAMVTGRRNWQNIWADPRYNLYEKIGQMFNAPYSYQTRAPYGQQLLDAVKNMFAGTPETTGSGGQRGLHSRLAPPINKPGRASKSARRLAQGFPFGQAHGTTTGELPPPPTSGGAGGGYYVPWYGYGGGGGDYTYPTYSSPFKEYRAGYPMEPSREYGTPMSRAAGEQTRYRQSNPSVYPARWNQILTNWRV